MTVCLGQSASGLVDRIIRFVSLALIIEEQAGTSGSEQGADVAQETEIGLVAKSITCIELPG